MDIQYILSTLAVMGLRTLRETVVMPHIVNRDYEQAVTSAQRNSTVNVTIPAAVQTIPVVPGPNAPATATVTPTSVPVRLTEHEEAPFFLSDSDLAKVNAGIIPMQAAEAMKSLANTIDRFLWAKYKDFYGVAGTAGTTPFATSTADFLEARRVANKQLMPSTDRYMVLDTDADANALGLANFQNASFSTDPNVIINGVIGKKLGALWLSSQNAAYHTAGTITTGLAAKAATAVNAGVKQVVCTTAASTGACALVYGDVFYFAGDDQPYVLKTPATQAAPSSDVTLEFEPPLQQPLVGGEAVTVLSSHAVNLLIHRDSVAFAMAPMAEANIAPGLAYMQPVVDEASGLAFRLEVTREHKRWRWSFDALWGAETVRRELGVRLIG